jgi:hypothetical protein
LAEETAGAVKADLDGFGGATHHLGDLGMGKVLILSENQGYSELGRQKGHGLLDGPGSFRAQQVFLRGFLRSPPAGGLDAFEVSFPAFPIGVCGG